MLNTDKIDAIYDYVPSDDSRNKFENFKTFERRKALESCTKFIWEKKSLTFKSLLAKLM